MPSYPTYTDYHGKPTRVRSSDALNNCDYAHVRDHQGTVRTRPGHRHYQRSHTPRRVDASQPYQRTEIVKEPSHTGPYEPTCKSPFSQICYLLTASSRHNPLEWHYSRGDAGWTDLLKARRQSLHPMPIPRIQRKARLRVWTNWVRREIQLRRKASRGLSRDN
jgi:hypothetical protein